MSKSARRIEIILDLQIGYSSTTLIPTVIELEQWISETLAIASYSNSLAEVTIRVIDNDEMRVLNQSYRGKNAPTNVLSFPFDPIHAEGLCKETNGYLGDILIAPDVLERESMSQHKSLVDHWAHMVVHGILHLLGFDHVSIEQAEEMEALEVQVLDSFGIINPYADTQQT